MRLAGSFSARLVFTDGERIAPPERTTVQHDRTGERVTHDEEVVDLPPGDELPESLRVEGAIGRDHDAPAGEQRAERHPVRGAVHERTRRQATGAALAGAVGELF